MVTVASGEIEEYQGSETAPKLRRYYSKDFIAANGDAVLRSTIESGDFYGEDTCSVASGVVTYPSHTLHPTTDAISNPRDSRVSYALFTAAGVFIQFVQKGLIVPDDPANTSLGALASATEDNDNPEPAPPADPTAITNGGGVPKITAQATAPAGPTFGEWWFETD